MMLASLLPQRLKKREAARRLQASPLAVGIGPRLQVVGHVVRREIVGQQVARGISCGGRVVVVIIAAVRSIAGVIFLFAVSIVTVVFFQCCIVEHLGTHALRQFRNGQFHELSHRHL